jgi:hypothetical protein
LNVLTELPLDFITLLLLGITALLAGSLTPLPAAAEC